MKRSLRKQRGQAEAGEPPRHEHAAPAKPSPKIKVEVLVDYLSVALLLAVAAFGVFRVPYELFSATTPILSYSYEVGFSNRVAVFALVAAIGLFCLRNLVWRQARPEPVNQLFETSMAGEKRPRRNMPVTVLLMAITIHIVSGFLLYASVPNLDEYGETKGTLPRVEQAMKCHLQLYKEIDWPYGPGLFYVPVACIAVGNAFGLPSDMGYMVAYSIISALSLGLLYYIVNNLGLRVGHRTTLFVIVAVIIFNLTLGVMYTGLRFLAPYAGVLFIHRLVAGIPSDEVKKSLAKIGALCFLFALIVLSISPEMGIAYILGQSVYLGHRAIFFNRNWWYLPPTTVLSLPMMLVLFPGFLHVLAGFSVGGNNFPVMPTAHIILYALTLFWIIPLLVRPFLKLDRSPNAAMALAWTGIVVMTIPAALGRCDPGHIMLNGLGAFMIALAAMAKFRPRLYPNYAMLFFVVYGVVIFYSSAVSYESYLVYVQRTLAGVPVPSERPKSPLIDGLKLADYPQIAAPLGADRQTLHFLLDSGRFAPQIHPDFGNVFDQKELDRKVKGLENVSAVLVPKEVYGEKGPSWAEIRQASDADVERWRTSRQPSMDLADNSWIGPLLVYPANLKTIHMPFDPKLGEFRYIAKHFYPVRESNGWLLMVPNPAETQLNPNADMVPALPTRR